MNLTSEQIQAIDNGNPVSIEVDGRMCILLSNTSFARMQAEHSQWHPDTMQRNLATVMADDWADPAMNVYDE